MREGNTAPGFGNRLAQRSAYLSLALRPNHPPSRFFRNPLYRFPRLSGMIM